MNITEADYCIQVEDKSLMHLGLFPGDTLMCDWQTTPSRFVIGVWNDEAHVCSLVDGWLFDEVAHNFAPEGAELFGRVLSVVRDLVVPEEAAQ